MRNQTLLMPKHTSGGDVHREPPKALQDEVGRRIYDDTEKTANVSI